MDSDKSFKVVLLGEGAVGKTSIMLRYTENKFIDKHVSTVQAAFASKQIELDDGARCEMAIWDTAGQERFHALGPIYYRDSNGALLVYDITDRSSFERVKKWVMELKQMLGNSVILFVIGNKIDLENNRKIPRDEGISYAESIDAHYLECSAKTNEGVSEVFENIAREMLKEAENEASLNGTGDANNAISGSLFQRHGSRRSIRIVDEPPAPERTGRKCC